MGKTCSRGGGGMKKKTKKHWQQAHAELSLDGVVLYLRTSLVYQASLSGGSEIVWLDRLSFHRWHCVVPTHLKCVWACFFQLQCQVDSSVNSCPQAMNKEFTIPGEGRRKEHENSFTLIDTFTSGLPQCACIHCTHCHQKQTASYETKIMKWKTTRTSGVAATNKVDFLWVTLCTLVSSPRSLLKNGSRERGGWGYMYPWSKSLWHLASCAANSDFLLT